MVPLSLGVAGLSKGSIESGLNDRARSALAAQSIAGVRVSGSGWGDIHLTGPASARDAALAAVAAMPDRSDANHISFTDDGSAAPVAATTNAPSTTPATSAATTPPTQPATTAAPVTAAPTTVAPTTAAPTTVAPTTAAPTTAPATTAVAVGSIDVVAASQGKQVTLSGHVATEAEHQALLAAATAAYGVTNVVDTLTVQTGTPTKEADAAVTQLGQLIGVFGSKLQDGQAHLVNTDLAVSGTAFTTEAAADLATALAAAKAAGVNVTGTFAAPAAATPDPAALTAKLRDLLGRSGIQFASGSANITAASQPVLDTAAQAILGVPGVNVQIAGYTDNIGSAAFNQTLSVNRAQAVLKYVVGKGVPAGQLTAVGFGLNNPIADNKTAQGRALNRRIEFTLRS
jgi:OmpA-OmpF porin, OOP family